MRTSATISTGNLRLLQDDRRLRAAQAIRQVEIAGLYLDAAEELLDLASARRLRLLRAELDALLAELE